MRTSESTRVIPPFNGPIEIGLRALAILNEAFPSTYSLQRLVVFDYIVVHSDDIPGGPIGLHPKTPNRSGELLVRRRGVQDGLLLYQSRGLIEQRYEKTGMFYAATERSASFLDTLQTEYLVDLRDRAGWLVGSFGDLSDSDLEQIVRENLGAWGAEFAMESVLWAEESP